MHTSVLVLLALLLASCNASVGGGYKSRDVRISSNAGLFTYAFAHQLNYTLVLNSSFCSEGTFVMAPSPFVPPNAGRYSIMPSGWSVLPTTFANQTSAVSCSVIYGVPESGYTVRFSFQQWKLAQGGAGACWAVWQADGTDIDYPIASSWNQYLAGPFSGPNMYIVIYDLTVGPPVAQGVICPGN